MDITTTWKIKKPIVALAPMEGYTDSAFRRLVKSFEPNILCFSEFTSADGLKFNSVKSLRKVKFDESEKPLIAQLFGKKPEHFIEAVKSVEKLNVSGIDINMGCPAKNVISSEHGGALLKNPELAIKIAKTVVETTKLPVSVKMRIGFYEYDKKFLNIFCKKLENIGIQMLTIHGRTVKQGYSGEADWKPIYAVKKHVNIPVIGNGDITSAKIAKKRLKKLDGVMIGRASLGNPWIMYEIYNELHKTSKKDLKEKPSNFDIARTHCELSVSAKGEFVGMREMRKHLASYIKGITGAAKFRARLVRVETLKEAFSLLNEAEKASSS